MAALTAAFRITSRAYNTFDLCAITADYGYNRDVRAVKKADIRTGRLIAGGHR